MSETNTVETRAAVGGSRLQRFVGRMGYALREAINEYRCWQLDRADRMNERCLRWIDALDERPSIRAERLRDRGA
jgi:hypothetical protein